MKNILYILLLTCFSLSAQIPGASADGTTDDTAAIQAELDGGGTVNFTASANYRITSALDIDQTGDQTINGNGATLVMTSGYINDAMVVVNKASGTAYIDDLNLDANGAYARMGYELASSYELTNSTIRDMYMPTGNTGTARGINIEGVGDKAFASALIDNVNIYDITAITSDCAVAGGGAGDGSSKGIQVNFGSGGFTYYTNDLTFTNLVIDGVWGDDADGLDIYMSSRHDLYTGDIVIDNISITNCARRLMKTTASNQTITNSTFTAGASDNVNLQGCTPVPMIEIFEPSGSPSSDYVRNITFRECTFDRTTGFMFAGFVIGWAQDITIEGCTFIDARIGYKNYWGDQYIIGNTFDSSSYLFNYASPSQWVSGTGLCETNNTVASPSSWNQIYSDGTPPTCPVSCYNGIQDGTETGVDTGGSCTVLPSVTGVDIYPTTDKLLVAGTRQLTEVIAPSNATDKTGTWTTTNGSVATVSSSGLVTATGTGTCTIQFETTDGSFTDTTSITVESGSTEDSIMILDPQGYYDGTSGDSDSWDDISGFELHGTEVGTITFTDQATFDGSSYYDLPDSDFLDFAPTVDEFTIVYREGDTAPTTSGYAISKRTSSTSQYGAFTYSGGTLNDFFLGGVNESAVNVTQANNRLVILVVTTTTVNAWIDGEQVVTASTAIGSELSTGQSANIGGRTDGSYLLNNGATLDIVAIIPKAINTAEREAIESEFQVNGAVASNSTKPTGTLNGDPIFYHGTTKKYLKQN